ncbi:MAG TPA: FlgD immunoglobulin-like domain containing protein [Candidatus Krumholzibacteria bacterium]|nr:FlgD immunoglobulin-like domain containing protein [Candidatus Krumholzibacteria bacterium]
MTTLLRRTLPVLLGCLLWAAAAAAVTVRLDPSFQTVDPGMTGSISMVTDEAVAIRTAEITLEVDPAILTTMTCTPGAVFDGVSCFIWEESEELAPGVWHGFAVIIGSTCQTAGPGELLHWEFTTGDEGVSPVTSVEVKLYSPDGLLIPDVTVDAPAAVQVGDVSDVPALAAAGLALAPNPFNPAVTLSVDDAAAGPARLLVLDARGRLVATAWSGDLSGGPAAFTWRGRDDGGRDAPSGTYHFVLLTHGTAPRTARGVLVR